ncbi:MAG: hypothetical protein IPJ65_28180 [Archangiaceae bacterium]|nr:hypothetical protein [Archangiaceae bacterium]
MIPAYYDTGDGTYSADELSNVQDSTEIMLHGDLRSIGCNEYGAAALPLMARLSGTSFPYLLLQK